MACKTFFNREDAAYIQVRPIVRKIQYFFFPGYHSTLKIAEINGDGDSLNHWKEEDLIFFCRCCGLLITTRTSSGHWKKGKDKLATLAYPKPVHLHEANITESSPPLASTDTRKVCDVCFVFILFSCP